MLSKYALAATACLIALPSWAVNKCTGPDGKVTFQELPCQGAGPTVKDELAAKERASALERESQLATRIKELEKQDKENQKRAAEESKIREQRASEERTERAMLEKHCGGRYLELRLGLTEEQVRYCTSYGHPDRVNTTQTVYGAKKQYVYNAGRPYGMSFLYFEKGLLTAIQN